MAEQVRDAAYWKRWRDEMNAFFDESNARYNELERRKQELKARLRARQLSPNPPLDIRWSSVSVPVTSGPGGYTVTVAAPPARKRRRWPWL